MKKNISINISGIIFHIEEDGYEILRRYLDSINRYFSSFEDSSEILADIESRIAEILLSKLSEGKQVVTAEDINTLTATMGSVSDFKAAEEQDFAAGEPRQEEKKQSSATGSTIANKKLYRDEKRKILGGVCAGLAHYFNIDPVWPRVLLALLVFASYGGLILLYIILWIVIPASTTLEEEETSVKKMFRDTEKKVIGGVASGVAAFFGVDVTFIRVAFIALTFAAGLGVVVYIIMWIALPEAKTITEKIQMQGDPVTLSNIESSVKRGLNEKDGQEESALVKIVLFPFRLIAAIINGLAKILGPVFLLLIDVLRIGIGVVITLTGVTMILSLIFIFAFALGFFNIPDGSIFNEWYLSAPDFPQVIRQSLPSWSIFFGFIIAFIPPLMIALLGSSIIVRKIVFNSYVGWTLFVTFFISVAFLSFTVPQIVYAFKEEGEYKVEKTFPIIGKAPIFRINETGADDFDMTDLMLKGYDGKDLKVVERFRAQGSTRKVAATNAQMVDYQIIQSDSVLTFDSDFTFRKDAKFRAQRLDIDLYIPYNQPFRLDDSMWRLIDNRYDYNYYPDRDENQTWKISEYGFLECITCNSRVSKTVDRMVTRDEFGLANFSSIDLQGIFDVRIQQGDQFAVEMKGPENERRRYQIYLDGETLVVDYDDDRDFFWKRDLIDDHEIELTITMPAIHELDAKGAGKIRLRGFSEEEMEIKLLGAVMADAQMDARNLTVDLTGASFLDLSGSGGFLDADITGASGLRAYSFEVKHAIVEAHGASSAKVFVTEKLEMEKGMASSISHRGNPEIIREN